MKTRHAVLTMKAERTRYSIPGSTNEDRNEWTMDIFNLKSLIIDERAEEAPHYSVATQYKIPLVSLSEVKSRHYNILVQSSSILAVNREVLCSYDFFSQ